MSLRVFLIDDHEYILDSVSRVLHKESITVEKTFTSFQGVISAYLELKPDVVVTDMRINNHDIGIDFCEELLAADKNAKIAILTQFDQTYLIEKAYRIGVMAYINKSDERARLIQGIRQTAKGKQYIPPSIAQVLAKAYLGNDPIVLLNDKERKVLCCLATGLKHDEIAKKMQMSTKMVSNYSIQIKSKLKTDRVAELTKLALKYGLIPLS